MTETFGIDVSHHNGKIDWKKVKQSNKTFAILKCQYEKLPHRIDETFEYNYVEAGKQGILRGVYIYIARDSMANIEADAWSLLKHLNNRKLEYGIWLDLEDASLGGKSKDYIRELVLKYQQIFTSAGYFVGIYCNWHWYNHIIPKEIKKIFEFWIARYPSKDKGEYNSNSFINPKSDYVSAWQYSSKGKVLGISTYCDLDVDYDGNIRNFQVIKKSVIEVAHEVIKGKWGTLTTNPSRKERLKICGYNYSEVQKKVNEILSRV